MKIIATADLHGNLPEIPECDLLILAGDNAPVSSHDRQFQADWYRSTFKDWLDAQPAKDVVWIGGNHDFVLQDWAHKRQKMESIRGHYLDHEFVVVNGLKIWGSPMSNRFGRWAFMAEETDLATYYKKIDRDIDILVTHGPVYGYGDFVPAHFYSLEKRGFEANNGMHLGSTSLANQLHYETWPNLKCIISGHIHEGYGKYDFNGVDVYGVSYLNERYDTDNPRDLVEIEL